MGAGLARTCRPDLRNTITMGDVANTPDPPIWR